MAPPTDRALEREGWQVAGAVEPFSVATLISRVLIKQVAWRGFAEEHARRGCVSASVRDRGTDLGWGGILPRLYYLFDSYTGIQDKRVFVSGKFARLGRHS